MPPAPAHEPPFHTPVFVLTPHLRPQLEFGGTTFHFVADGMSPALEAVEGKDVANVRHG